MRKYIEKQRNAIKEKLFFMEDIDIRDYDIIVDYNAESGVLMREILPYVNENASVLITNNNENAREIISNEFHDNTRGYIVNVLPSSNLYDELVHTEDYKKLIIFNSSLHYLEPKEQEKIFKYIVKEFDTIVVRDMKRPLNNEPISNETRCRVLNKVPDWQADLFESRWGVIDDKYKLYRFFLMNEYVDTFEDEVEIDYFSALWTELSDILTENNYTEIRNESFTLPYRYEQVKKRFNHTMRDITHRRIVFSKRSEENVDSDQ